MDNATEKAVVAYAVDQAAHVQHRTSDELRKAGIFVSGSGLRSTWVRHNLENKKIRLKELGEKVASYGIILTVAQVAALEKKKHDHEPFGEIETVHLGYPGGLRTHSTSATCKVWNVSPANLCRYIQ